LLFKLAHGNTFIIEDCDTLYKKKMLYLIIQDPWILQFTDHETKNDKEFIHEAVKHSPECLCFAGEEARNDIDIALEAVGKDTEFFKCVGESLRRDASFILEVFLQNDLGILDAKFFFSGTGYITGDRLTVLYLVIEYPWMLQYVSPKLENDKDFILEAVKQSPYSLCFADDKMKNDKVIALEAVKQDIRYFGCVSESLKQDSSFVFDVLNLNDLDILDTLFLSVWSYPCKPRFHGCRRSSMSHIYDEYAHYFGLDWVEYPIGHKYAHFSRFELPEHSNNETCPI